jgi:two-component system chemotaxis response regulator CheB
VNELPCPAVALVASAGGLTATSQVLQDLPADVPACVLVLLHTPPHRSDRLAEVLTRKSGRPVGRAEDGVPLREGTAWVAPAGCHLLVTPEGRLSLIISGSFPPSRPSADLLLTSMALSLGPLATAVIMSGAGNDGATGATAIHKHGGLVLTSDQLTSAHWSMPRAAIERDQAVDDVVPVHHLAEAVVKRLVTAAQYLPR